MERASNARSVQQIAHAFPDFGSLLLRSLQVVTERASNARSIQQITHAFPDFGSLLQIWAVLRVNVERASNARHIYPVPKVHTNDQVLHRVLPPSTTPTTSPWMIPWQGYKRPNTA